MKVRNLDHLNLSVSDLAETVGWYQRLFGFEQVEQGVYEGHPWAILRSNDAMLCAYEHPSAHAPADPEGTLYIRHFGLRIDDPEAFEAALAREGVVVEFGGQVRWPHSTSWYVRDPSNYQIEVVHWDGDAVSF